jgi:hypothetical protein
LFGKSNSSIGPRYLLAPILISKIWHIKGGHHAIKGDDVKFKEAAKETSAEAQREIMISNTASVFRTDERL